MSERRPGTESRDALETLDHDQLGVGGTQDPKKDRADQGSKERAFASKKQRRRHQAQKRPREITMLSG